MKRTSTICISIIILVSISITGCWTHPSPSHKEKIIPEKIKTYKENDNYLEDTTLYFCNEKYELNERSTYQLVNLIDVLNKIDTNQSITIEGHASEKGSDSDNLMLSKSRVSAVMKFISDNNLSKNHIISQKSYGKSKPICNDDDSEECHKQNRRVEIKVANQGPAVDYLVEEGNVHILRSSMSQQRIKSELLKLQKIESNKYTIGSGDKFDLYIYGEPELSIKGGIVKYDGTLTVTMIGDVKISGLTINEAMTKISKELTKWMVEPIVTLVPSEFSSKNYTIIGKVMKPGNYPVGEKTRVLDTIADAGGLSIGIFKDSTIELADLEHAFIRRGSSVLPVDFAELVRKGNPLHNIPMQDKDYVYIPSALNTEVYILGEVNIQGYFGYKEHMTLSQLISYSEGFKNTANIEQVAIVRGHLDDPSVYIVNLNDIIEGKAADFPIKPYDMVFIPKSKLGDWNTILQLMLPSLESVSSGFIINQLFKGN